MDETAQQALPTPPQQPSPSAFPTADRIAAVVIGLAAIIIGLLAGRLNPFLTNAGSWEGAQIDALFSGVLAVSAAIFTIVEGVLLYVIFRYRRPYGDQSEGVPFRRLVPLELAWTAIPVVIVTGLAIFSYRTMTSIEAASPDELVIEVRARQFAWSFTYPGNGVTSNELHIPQGRKVLLRMHSADVIHSLWVPDFRIKKDLLPDRITEERFTGTRLGTHLIACSRLCGVGHTYMITNLIVQTPADFQTWLTSESTAQADTSDPIAYGRRIFQKYGCGGCHTLGDAGTAGNVGPNLNGIGTRAAHRVASKSAAAYIQESIVKPDAYVVLGYPAHVMPQSYEKLMTPQELDTLVEYLLAQQQP